MLGERGKQVCGQECKEEHTQGAEQQGLARLTVNVPKGERESDTATVALEFVRHDVGARLLEGAACGYNLLPFRSTSCECFE